MGRKWECTNGEIIRHSRGALRPKGGGEATTQRVDIDYVY